MTHDAELIVHQGYCFRSNEYGQLGLVPFANCLHYESITLHNKDIYYTIRDLYDIFVDTRKKKEKINEIVLRELSKRFGLLSDNQLYAIWGCATADQVKQYYGPNPTKIIIPTRAIVVSDLGSEGALLVAPWKDWRCCQ